MLLLCVVSSRMIEIQTAMSERAIELLALPKDQPAHILDIGNNNANNTSIFLEYHYFLLY